MRVSAATRLEEADPGKVSPNFRKTVISGLNLGITALGRL